MQEIPSLLEKANKLQDVADHLTFVTYPIVKEPKLIYTISEHIFNACTAAMDALIYYEYIYKRIGPYPEDNFAAKMTLLKQTIGPRYNIERKHIFLIEDLKEIIDHRKRSHVEFVKNNEVIMCGANYDVKTVTIEKIKNYVYESKEFLGKVNSLLRRNARRH